MTRKPFIAALTLTWLICSPVFSQVLHGGVEEQDFRIRRKQQQQAAGQGLEATVADTAPPTAPPLSGNLQAAGRGPLVPLEGFAQAPNTKLDIGIEAQSKEMVLAWERWHKQLAGAIYSVWDRRAKTPGRATVKITVYSNRTMVAELLSCSGGQEYRRTLMSVFDDLNGNPGLTFPAKSQRQKVAFEAEYIAGSNVDPGYSWLKNDFEKVREDR